MWYGLLFEEERRRVSAPKRQDACREGVSIMALRDEVWHILNDPEDGRYGIFLSFITLMILLSVGLLLFETFAMDHLDVATRAQQTQVLYIIDRSILVIFLIEYAARLWVIRDWRPDSVRLNALGTFKYFIYSRLRFIFSPWGFIDLLSLLPLVPFLRSLRVLRLLRLFRSIRLFRYHNPLRVLASAIRDNALLFGVAFGVVVVNILLSAVMFFFAEYGHNEKVENLGDTLWWSIVTISTVGFGDITPETVGGRVIGAALMISGMFVIAIFAGVISSTLVGHLIPLQMERVRMSSISDHIVIAGWNDNLPMLLEQLEREHQGSFPTVILFAPIERPESLDPKYVFVHGDFTKEAEYEKVRLNYARTLVVVADTSRGDLSSSSRDATTVLTVFTARRLERIFPEPRTRPLHICAEILDPENMEHARVAGSNEVLATALVGNSLLAHTAVNPGVGSILSDILLATRHNIYTSPIPSPLLEGKLIIFGELQELLRKDHDVLLMGIIQKEQIKLNPDPQHPVFLEDKIIYLGSRQLGVQ